MAEKLGRIIDALTTCAVVLAVVATVALVGPRLFGVYPYTVMSGSMEPEYPVGSLVYVREAEPADLAVGDVITYLTGRDAVVTHRIVDVVPDADDPSVIRYMTQGDANEHPDGQLVHQDNVVGTPVVCVPLLGFAANALLEPPGSYLALSAAALLVALMFLPDLLAPSGRREEGEAEEASSPGVPPHALPRDFSDLTPDELALRARRELERRQGAHARPVSDSRASARSGAAASARRTGAPRHAYSRLPVPEAAVAAAPAPVAHGRGLSRD